MKQQASRFRWMHPSLPGLKCCYTVASAVTNGVVGQGSKCSKASVIPGKCSSVCWLSDKSHTAQCTQLFRPAPPDGFHFAGEVTTLNLSGRQKKKLAGFGARTWVLAFPLSPCWDWKLLSLCTLCLQTASHDHIRHGLSWCGATVNIVPQFLPIEAFAWNLLLRLFGACSNLQNISYQSIWLMIIYWSFINLC